MNKYYSSFTSLTFNVVLFFFLALISITLGSESFDAFRTIQFVKDGKPLGSHKSSLNFLSTSYLNAFDEELSRSRAIILPHKEFIRRTELFRNGIYPESITSNAIGLYQKSIAGGASGVIVILPLDLDVEEVQWREAENTLLQNELLIPFYFVFEHPNLHIVLEDVERTNVDSLKASPLDFILGDQHKLIINAKDGSQIKSLLGTNLQGWLAGGGESSQTIAIFAHYDSFAAAPQLATSAHASISGTTMILELARIFSKLYSSSRTQASHNLLFVLTSAGELNFRGSKQWLKDADERILKSLQFVLCLDSVGSDNLSDDLFLYTSRPKKDPTAKRLYDSFSQSATQLGRTFQIMQNKVNFSNTEEPWEHEHFSKQKILASTLSTRRTALGNLGRSHLFDNRQRVNNTVLRENIRLVAEALAKFIFDISVDNMTIFDNYFAPDQTLIDSWVETLDQHPRVFPYIKPEIVNGLEQTLRVYTSDLTKQTFVLDKSSGYEFFTLVTDSTNLETYIVKPFAFDVVLALGIVTYLAAVYFAVKYFPIFGV